MELSSRPGGENMEQSVVETVEVVSGGERVLSPGGTETTLKIINPGQLNVPLSSGIIEIDPQALSLVQMTTSNFDVSTVTPLSLATTHSTGLTGASILPDIHIGTKRSSDDMLVEGQCSADVPRKKSRNYLDSHKTIEKKRRDRINNGLSTLKEMVPNCRQYGSKKLDKAEVLEMTIDYIQRLHQSQSNSHSNVDLASSRSDWANEIMSWIFQNKLLYSGPNAIEQFSNALLLHLQSYVSPPTGAGTVTSSTSEPSSDLIYNQYTTSEEQGTTTEDERLQHHSSLLQQISNSSGGNESSDEQHTKDISTGAAVTNSSTSQQQQTQLAQLQALLLLQQQHVFQNQQHDSTSTESESGHIDQTQQIQQLQQLHQLQTLLLQHLANEPQKETAPIQEEGRARVEPITVTCSSVAPQSIMVTDAAADSTAVELSLSSAITTALAPPPVYTTEDTLGTASTQMWSQEHNDSPLLIDSVTEGGVQEEVELLEQEH